MKNGKSSRQFLFSVAILLFLVGFSPALRAAGQSAEGVRADHPLGGYVSLWGDPFPALWGANIAYNVYDFLRLNAGVGTESTSNIVATTFGIGGKVFVPGWALTPMLGLGWSADNVSSGHTVDIRGIKRGGNRLYWSFGLDWQTTLGFSVGTGYENTLSMSGGSGFLNVGFFL